MRILRSAKARRAEARLMEEAPAADPDRTRFLVELEFVQSLANPHYLGWLAAGSLPALASAHFFIPPYAARALAWLV
jgi:hypothetical protein